MAYISAMRLRGHVHQCIRRSFSAAGTLLFRLQPAGYSSLHCFYAYNLTPLNPNVNSLFPCEMEVRGRNMTVPGRIFVQVFLMIFLRRIIVLKLPFFHR